MKPAAVEGADLLWLSLAEAAELLRTRKLSPVALTESCLRRITRLQPTLNAFITVTAEAALKQARAAEAEIAQGKYRGPLHGIPVALKDLFDTAGVHTTAASALFRERIPAEDAEVVRRLGEAGAVLLGKTNLHEFAYGGSGVVSAFGVASNPWAPERIAGGSSSGSAAAVASGMCFAALGTDTAGSIRLPAACCGVVGLKPTYGLVSARGVIPLAWSYDHVGPITRTVRDAALVLQAIAGFDAADPHARRVPVAKYSSALKTDVSSLRLGWATKFFFEGLDREVEMQFEEATRVLQNMTGGTREVEVPVDADRTVHAYEAYSYHARWVAESPDKYHPETLRRICTGEGISQADYEVKRKELEESRQNAQELFAKVDLLITPTTPAAAPKISELLRYMNDLRKRELVLLRNTRPFNVLGLPAISLPCGFTSNGLPVGLQITGRAGDEAMVLRLAYAYEQATEWHRRRAEV